MTSDTGAWKQTIFYPYLHASTMGRGTVLNTAVKVDTYESKYGDAPFVDAVVIADEGQKTLTLFAVNKDLKSDYSVTMDVRQFEGYQVQEHILLTNEDLKAVNTEEKPDNVAPVLCENSKVGSAGEKLERDQAEKDGLINMQRPLSSLGTRRRQRPF